MTLGTGIFLSTVLVLIAISAVQITRRGKWRAVGKWAGAGVLLCAVVGMALFGWLQYEQRPQIAEALNGVKLGMSQLDVQLAKGKATETDVNDDDTLSIYKLSEDAYIIVVFRGDTPGELKVAIVCEEGGYSTLLGFGRFSSENDVLDKLGPPTNTSVHAEGLTKMISYAPYKVAYEIEKGKVTGVCVTSSGKVAYGQEYGKGESTHDASK